MEEVWRPVVGWEGWYSVSDQGRVRREREGGSNTYAGKLLKGWLIDGYPALRLHQPGSDRRVRKIHHLVLEAFVGPCPEGKQTHHKDADRANNHLSNLEYVTLSENTAHMYRLGRRKHHGEDGPNARLTTKMVCWIRKMRGNVRGSELAKFFGVTPTQISYIQLRKSWQEVRN